jgi:hypothetical protein
MPRDRLFKKQGGEIDAVPHLQGGEVEEGGGQTDRQYQRHTRHQECLETGFLRSKVVK